MGKSSRFGSIAGNLILLAWCLTPRASGSTTADLLPPTGFKGTALSESEIKWEWDRDAGASRYFVEDDQGNLIAVILDDFSDPVTFTDSGLSAGTEVCRQVRSSVDTPEGRCTSDPTELVCVTTLGGIEPPTNFGGEALSTTEIRWFWDPVVGISCYRLEDENNSLIAEVTDAGQVPIEFFETGLTPDTTFIRHVRSVFNGQTSQPTADVGITTFAEQQPPTCEVMAEGNRAVLVGKSGFVVFRASTAQGKWDRDSVKISPRVNMNFGVISVGALDMRVRVTGQRKSKKVGDTRIEAQYTCPDGTKKKARWDMTVIGPEDKSKSLTVVALPPEPGFTIELATDQFSFIAYPPLLTDTKLQFTDVSDDGDDTGRNRGDLEVRSCLDLPSDRNELPVEADGVHDSKRIDDVTALAEAEATFTLEGERCTVTATGRRLYTVGPLRDQQLACQWETDGPPGAAIPEKNKPSTKVIVKFFAKPDNKGKLRFRKIQNPDATPGVKLNVAEGLDTDNMNVRVTVTESALPSPFEGNIVITVQYECEEDGKSTFGFATHQFTLFKLTN